MGQNSGEEQMTFLISNMLLLFVLGNRLLEKVHFLLVNFLINFSH